MPAPQPSVPSELNAQIALARREMAQQIPQSALDVMAAAAAEQARSGVAQQAVQVGEQAPDFTLPDQHGQPTNLATLLTQGPVVVSFFRGGWCPFCSMEMGALRQIFADITALGAHLVAIAPETSDTLTDTDTTLRPGFPLLSDLGAGVAADYRLRITVGDELNAVYNELGINLAQANGDPSGFLPLPATYVIATDGRVVAAHVDVDYTTRMEPSHILDTLNTLIKG